MFDYTNKDLEQFCTAKQLEVLRAFNAKGSQYKAAESLNCSRGKIVNALKAIKKKATDHGYVEGHPYMPIGEGKKLGKMTTQVNGKGEVKNVWFRQDDKLESINDAIESMCSQVAGLAPKIRSPRKNNKDLLSVYNIGDMHFGMHAWHKEVGVDFDLDIATKDIINSMSDLIGRANNSETAIILNLGDAIHFHDDTHATKGNGNPLDADGRVDKVFGITCRVMNQIVEMALQKHKHVIVRNVTGNHDMELAMALRFQMDAYWRSEKRVSIEMTPADAWFYQFGKVMLMATHGHNLAPIKMIPYMSAREPKMWGETLLRRALHGHFHSKSVIESLGGKVEGFSNLAPNDAWHASKGYLSELECVMIEYHSCGKEVGRQNYMLHQHEVGYSDNAGMLGKY